MGRFNFTGLEDKDIIACYVLAGTESGKINEIEFEKLLDQRRGQVKQELVTLGQEITKLGISDDAFERMGRVYLTSQEHQCSMQQAEEIYTKLEQEREKKGTSDYAKIVESLKTPSYGDVENSKKVEKLTDDGTVEWIHSCDVKLAQLKKKYRR